MSVLVAGKGTSGGESGKWKAANSMMERTGKVGNPAGIETAERRRD
jgi:hypothetical protein